MSFRAIHVENAGFWHLKAPETSIWAPEGAFAQKNTSFLYFCYDFFLYIWQLARPNIAEKGPALVEKAKLSSRDQVGC